MSKRREQVKKFQFPGRKKSERDSHHSTHGEHGHGTEHHDHHSHSTEHHGHSHQHHEHHTHSAHDEKIANSKQLDEAYKISNRIVEKLQHLATLAHHGSGIQPALNTRSGV